MKKVISIVGAAVLSFAMVQSAMAQATANQNLNLAVDAVYKIAASGNPGAMTITTGTAGNNVGYTITLGFSVAMDMAGKNIVNPPLGE